LLNLTLIVL
jgi:hypothetical protein